jgi:hypothetical protein
MSQRIPSWLNPGAIVRHRPSGVLFPVSKLKRAKDGRLAVANAADITRFLDECEESALPSKPFLWQPETKAMHVSRTRDKPIQGINLGDEESPHYLEIREADELDEATHSLASFFDGDIYDPG